MAFSPAASEPPGPDLHGGGGADRGPVGDRDGLGGQADQRAGGDGAPVHEGHRPDARRQQRVANLDRGVHPPAERVDIEDDGRRASVGGLGEDAAHEGREPQVDDALDRGHVDHGPVRLRTPGRAGGEQGEQTRRRDPRASPAAPVGW